MMILWTHGVKAKKQKYTHGPQEMILVIALEKLYQKYLKK